MVDTEIEANRSTAKGRAWLSHPTWTAIWQTLRHPVLLLAVAGLLLILQATALFLPQMPGQFTEEAAERARWLLSAQQPYGSLGALLAWLGLFDFAHSYVLRGLLALLILLVLMQLGDLLAAVQRVHNLRRRLAESVAAPGTPLLILGSQTIYRHRSALPFTPTDLAKRLSTKLGQPPNVELHSNGPENSPENSTELRWLHLDHLPFLYLRAVLAGAATAGLILLWVILTLGWEADPPLLAPDGSFRLPARDLRLAYQLTPPESDTQDPAAPVLVVSVGEARRTLDVRRAGQLRLGGVDIWSTPSGPALVVESWDGDAPVAALALPGQADLRERASFAFPSAGSEESVLIPLSELGVRLVRLPDANRFLVEVVSSASEAETQRTEINADDAIVVPYPGTADGELVLRFRYLPTLDVHVQAMPGDWLILPLLLLAAVGAVGLLRRPRFLLCQIAPWPPERAVLVAQSDDSTTTATLANWAAALRSPTPLEEDAA